MGTCGSTARRYRTKSVPLVPGRELSLRRNGGAFVAFTRTESDTEQQQVSTQVRLQAGDYIEAWVFQESHQPIRWDGLLAATQRWMSTLPCSVSK